MEYEAVKQIEKEIKRLGGCGMERLDVGIIRAGATHTDWIPVSERLPEEKGEYLVTYHPCYWDNVNDKIRTGMDTFRGKTKWAKEKYQKVIAWMPLPEPYKPEQNTQESGAVAGQYADADVLMPAT